MSELLDARGVLIEPGDTVIYGFSVSRSVAMAEGEVVGAHGPGSYDVPGEGEKVSLTASGLVRVRVIRRSYASGEKPVVALRPDRIVVLKRASSELTPFPFLPPSPLPTQDELYREGLEGYVARYKEGLRATEVPDWWRRGEYGDLGEYYVFAAERLAQYRKKLAALDE